VHHLGLDNPTKSGDISIFNLYTSKTARHVGKAADLLLEVIEMSGAYSGGLAFCPLQRPDQRQVSATAVPSFLVSWGCCC